MWYENPWVRVIGILVVVLLLEGCSQTKITAGQQMLVNLSKSYPSLWRAATGGAYLCGMIFILRGVYQLKQYGDMKTMMSSGHSITGPLLTLLVGSSLMYLPTIKSSLLVTTFGVGQQTAIAYSQFSPVLDEQAMYALMGLIQLVGLFAFIRGFIQLSKSSNPSSQAGVSKAITHIIGGLCAINIQGTINMIQATFGIG